MMHIKLLQLRYLINIGEDVACQGLYDRKYEIVYGDKTAGATTSLTLWKKSRATGDELIAPHLMSDLQ